MRSRVLRLAATMLAVASFGLAGMRPAAADAPLQKVTIALAGKALAFIIQYIAIGGGFYKEEGLDPDPVDVASGTRQAAAVMGGSAEITQVGFAHTMHAVGRGGDLVGICTAFDV
jgi:NitT/TauT family transport system substrate-binding protein